MKSTKRLIVAAAAVSICLVSVAGVAGAAPAPDPVKQALVAAQAKMTPPTKIGQTIPLKSPAPKGLKVVFLSNGNAQTEIIAGGVKEAIEAIGGSYESITYNSANAATLQQAMMNALQKNPSGVVTVGEDQGKWGNSVTTAYAEAKVPIIAGSTCPVVQTGSIFQGAGTCGQLPPVGKVLADWIIADSGGRANILLQSMPSFNVYITFREAFQAELKAKCPGCSVKIQDTNLTQFAAGQIPSALVSTLRANPEITYLFFDNSVWSTGILPALDAAGLLGRIKVGGSAINDLSLAGLKNKQMVVWSAASYVQYGYANVDSLLRVLTKSTGITKNSAIPFQLVTSVNAGGVTLPYVAPANALAQYKKLWKVS